MMSLWDATARADLAARAGRLTATTPAQWGKFDATRMLAHLNDALRMALGDLAIPPKRMVIRYPPLKQLIVYVLPMPKNVPTAPALLARAPEGFDTEQIAFGVLLETFAAQPRDRAWPAHPAFGPLGSRGWGVLAARHSDHHLRQFGV